MCSMLPCLIPRNCNEPLLCSRIRLCSTFPLMSACSQGSLCPPSVCSVALSLFIALKVTIDQIVSALQLQPWMGRKRNWLQSIQQQIELYWLVPCSCRRGALLPFNYHGYPFLASVGQLHRSWGEVMFIWPQVKALGCAGIYPDPLTAGDRRTDCC